jgi:hypothetical protein
MRLIEWCRLQWDRALGIGVAFLGAIALVIGWQGASTTPYPAEQLPYLLSGGLGGLFLLGVGGTLWISADLRDEWRKLDRLEECLTATQSEPDDHAPPRAPNGSKGRHTTATSAASRVDVS